MSVTVLDEAHPVARKAHHCDVCLGTIGVGDQYLRQRNVGDDGPYVFKAHALCWAISIEAHDASYDDDWLDPCEVRCAIEEWFEAVSGPSPAASAPKEAER